MKATPEYWAFKLAEQQGPGTPRPERGSKRQWESKMFQWRNAIRHVNLLVDDS